MSVYDSVNWGVHVDGPYSVLAAKNFTESVEQCDRINRNLVKMQPEFDNEYYPILWAKWHSVGFSAFMCLLYAGLL